MLAALAEAAASNNYTKPHVHDGDDFVVADARHPVVERRTASAGEPFVPNDVHLNATTSQLVILTGPNMGGKSTYLRQTALLAIMAQSGSFVPAREAKIPLVDRIFARVGASDNIARGHSTFMIEMQETASILHNATSRSLVVLDEIGRGTATFDGPEHRVGGRRVSRDQSGGEAEDVVRHPLPRAHRPGRRHARRRQLSRRRPRVEGRDRLPAKNRAGRSDRSYGIQVARLAGLPRTVIDRAREILGALERDELTRGGRPSVSGTTTDPQRQLGLFQRQPADDRLRERLSALDVDRITPIDALALLADLKRDAQR